MKRVIDLFIQAIRSSLRFAWNLVVGFFRLLGLFLLAITKITLVIATAGTLAGGIVGYFIVAHYNQQLPDNLSAVADYSPRSLSQVFSDDGELIGEFFLERRIVMSLDQIGNTVIQAFLAAEDARFFQHKGIDPAGIGRALLSNVKAGRVVQGGSTITQQVVKNLLLTSERSIARKVKEAILSFRVENELTKDEILHIYLNMVYLGHGAYGVEAAALSYFGKHSKDLSIAQAAMLAGLVKAPSSNSPYLRFQRAKDRQKYVLRQMIEGGFITADQAKAAEEEAIHVLSTPDVNHQAAPYFVEHVRRLVMARYGGQLLYGQGLKIETTLRMDWQRAARFAVRSGVEEVEARSGYHGPDGQIVESQWTKFREKTWREVLDLRILEGRSGETGLLEGEVYAGVVLANSRAGIRIGIGPFDTQLDAQDLQLKAPRLVEEDIEQILLPEVLPPGSIVHVTYRGQPDGMVLPLVTLHGTPAAQAALVAIEPGTGFVRAMVGGYDFRLSRFNRAVQARRQAGSSFKPFVYAAALEKGRTQFSVEMDAPVSFVVPGGRTWSPKNYGNRYFGAVTLRTALTKSLNSISVKLLNETGVDSVIRVARSLGIQSPLPSNLSLALGSADVSLLEMTSAYAGIAGNGLVADPVFIRRITDSQGHVLEDTADRLTLQDSVELLPEYATLGQVPTSRQAISPASAFVLTDMMKEVIESGTAKRIKALGRPVGGKTGTTNNYIDAWFIGSIPQLTCGIWVGTDTRHPLGNDETGGKTAAPIWLSFMTEVAKSVPPEDFSPPPDVVFVKVDPSSGNPTSSDFGRYMPFARSTLPSSYLMRTASRDPADDL